MRKCGGEWGQITKMTKLALRWLQFRCTHMWGKRGKTVIIFVGIFSTIRLLKSVAARHNTTSIILSHSRFTLRGNRFLSGSEVDDVGEVSTVDRYLDLEVVVAEVRQS